MRATYGTSTQWEPTMDGIEHRNVGPLLLSVWPKDGKVGWSVALRDNLMTGKEDNKISAKYAAHKAALSILERWKSDV